MSNRRCLNRLSGLWLTKLYYLVRFLIKKLIHNDDSKLQLGVVISQEGKVIHSYCGKLTKPQNIYIVA